MSVVVSRCREVLLKGEAGDRRRWGLALVAGGACCYVVYKRMTRKRKKASSPLLMREAKVSEVVGGPPPSGKAWTTVAEGDLERGVSAEGPAAWASETVPFLVERLGSNDTPALAWEASPDGDAVVYVSWTWREYVAQVRRAAASMTSLGLEPRTSCAILGFNSKEWLVADLAAIVAGGFATGIYATNGVESVRYIVEHSRAAIVVVEGAKQAAKVEAALAQETFNVKSLVSYGPDTKPFSSKLLVVKCMLWDEFMAASPKTNGSRSGASPGECCTLIYTSGTTGTPKAVMVSHDNITWIVRSFACVAGFGHARHEKLISYLPLSHIAAQTLDVYANLACAGRTVGDATFGCTVEVATVYFARPDALKGSLKLTLCAVRPTVFFGVPRVFEKFAEALQAVGARTTGLKKHVSTWAKSVALAKYRRLRADAPSQFPGIFGLLQETLAAAVLKKVHAAIGLDRCHVVFTGAAPIAVATLEYFGSLGLTVNEAFGMSEVAGPAAVTVDDYYVPGTCGVACPGIEIKLDHLQGRDKPGEGEICFRGRGVMLGYLRNDEKTRETIDDDGWLHSGDTGTFVFPVKEEGKNPMLKITGRIKELLITAGGENVAPVPIEDAVKSLLPQASTCVVVGDKLKFLSLLVTLKQRPNEATGSFDDVLVGPALDVDPLITTATQAADSPAWTALVQRAIDTYNDTVAVSAAQRIQKFAILPLDFSQATGELTPTLKLKRTAVVDKYAHTLKKIYGASASAVWA
ncbi:hypothetical protein CTAYLR_002912 [Chrysophaeum taylorii]|uniref:AMP-dependent synthetase/ligase domain-containing protein n=1 Tax=Chrysophaeum taylorii TaxID=2483200 RepID=A0AAD7XR19_9STRA|nr:hypothetical protein CTAYLR_002912 [Chrysophaeum taylorii]